MSDNVLKATPRERTGHQVRALRRDGQLPAVLYGPGVAPRAIEMNLLEASRVLRRVHGAQLLDLELEGETRKVLLQDMQRDSLKGHFLHIDLYAVDMNRPIRVRLPIRLVGVSYAIAALSGVLVHGVTELEVECLPGDLVISVDADLGALKEIGHVLRVKDLYLPKTIRILSDPDDMVARVTYQAKEEDLSLAPGTVPTEVEVIEKGKTEEEGAEE